MEKRDKWSIAVAVLFGVLLVLQSRQIGQLKEQLHTALDALDDLQRHMGYLTEELQDNVYALKREIRESQSLFSQRETEAVYEDKQTHVTARFTPKSYDPNERVEVTFQWEEGSQTVRAEEVDGTYVAECRLPMVQSLTATARFVAPDGRARQEELGSVFPDMGWLEEVLFSIHLDEREKDIIGNICLEGDHTPQEQEGLLEQMKLTLTLTGEDGTVYTPELTYEKPEESPLKQEGWDYRADLGALNLPAGRYTTHLEGESVDGVPLYASDSGEIEITVEEDGEISCNTTLAGFFLPWPVE